MLSSDDRFKFQTIVPLWQGLSEIVMRNFDQVLLQEAQLAYYSFADAPLVVHQWFSRLITTILNEWRSLQKVLFLAGADRHGHWPPGSHWDPRIDGGGYAGCLFVTERRKQVLAISFKMKEISFEVKWWENFRLNVLLETESASTQFRTSHRK